MPRGDRTGPMGAGPMTGRGAGPCAGYPMPGYANPGYGRGWRQGGGFGGGGRGWRQAGGFESGGRGWRRRFYATGLPRWARPEEVVAAPEGEANWLRERANWLKDQLEAINLRIAEIEKGSAE